jgi:hypothetical protein
MRKTTLVLLSLLVLGAGVANAAPPDGERILFVGNSLTFWNNLPATVCELARSTGKKVTCDAVTYPNFSLEDHWQTGAALKRMKDERWTWVIIQQGSSALPESRRYLVEYSGRFADAARAAGARPALYQVWPRKSRSGDFDAVIESHRIAAEKSGSTLVPAGDAWKQIIQSGGIELYDPDGLHPSPAGSYLAALVMYRSLFGEIPESFTRPRLARKAGEVQLSEAELKRLREVAQGVK